MTPSRELRNMAAKRHDMMTTAEDRFRMEQDGELDLRGNGYNLYIQHAAAYRDFCKEQGFDLVTDASGLFLRCAETGIPLVIGDEYDELETGECVLVKRAA